MDSRKRRNRLELERSASAAMSAPAEKARRVPMKTTVRIAESARTLRTTAASSLTICGLIAFSFSGRASRTQAMASSTSKRRVSYTRSHHGQAAAHRECLSGDVGGIVRREEGDGCGDLLRLADPPERHGALQRFGELRVAGADFREERCVRWSRADDVDVDLIAGE